MYKLVLDCKEREYVCFELKESQLRRSVASWKSMTAVFRQLFDVHVIRLSILSFRKRKLQTIGIEWGQSASTAKYDERPDYNRSIISRNHCWVYDFLDEIIVAYTIHDEIIVVYTYHWRSYGSQKQ